MVTVISLAASINGGAPGTPITISGVFNPGLTTIVVFKDAVGYEVDMPVDVSNATTIATLVPVYINMQTFVVGPGAVSVSVVQMSGQTQITSGPVTGFQIQSLPTLSTTPGAVTLSVLQFERDLVQVATQKWQTIQTSSTSIGAPSVSNNIRTLLANLTSEATAIDSEIAAVKNLMAGNTSQIMIRTVRGQNTFVDSTSIGLMDQIFVAYFFAGQSGPTPTAMNQHRLHKSSTGPDDSTVDPISGIASEFQQLIGSTLPQQILSFATKYRNAALGVTLGALLVAGTGTAAIPALAVAGVGALMFTSAVWIPAVYTSTLEGTAATMFQPQASPSDFQDTALFLKESVTDAIEIKDGALESSAQIIEDKIMGTAEDAASQAVEAIASQLDPTNPNSLASEVVNVFSTIESALPPPSPAGSIATVSVTSSPANGYANITISATGGVGNGLLQVTGSWADADQAIPLDETGAGSIVIQTPLSSSCYAATITVTDGVNTLYNQTTCFDTGSTMSFSGSFTGTIQDLPAGAGPCPGSASETGTVTVTLVGLAGQGYTLSGQWVMTQGSGICNDYSGTYNLIGGADAIGNFTFTEAGGGSTILAASGTLSNGSISGTWALGGGINALTGLCCADVVDPTTATFTMTQVQSPTPMHVRGLAGMSSPTSRKTTMSHHH